MLTERQILTGVRSYLRHEMTLREFRAWFFDGTKNDTDFIDDPVFNLSSEIKLLVWEYDHHQTEVVLRGHLSDVLNNRR